MDVHLSGKLLLLLVDAARDISLVIQQNGDTRVWNDRDKGTEGNARSRGPTIVAVDGGRLAGMSAERPHLNVETSIRTEGVPGTQGGIAGDALATPNDAAQGAMSALLRVLVEHVQVAGTVGTDGENPGETHRA